MRHARADALDQSEALLVSLRALPRLKESLDEPAWEDQGRHLFEETRALLADAGIEVVWDFD